MRSTSCLFCWGFASTFSRILSTCFTSKTSSPLEDSDDDDKDDEEDEDDDEPQSSINMECNLSSPKVFAFIFNTEAVYKLYTQDSKEQNQK